MPDWYFPGQKEKTMLLEGSYRQVLLRFIRMRLAIGPHSDDLGKQIFVKEH